MSNDAEEFWTASIEQWERSDENCQIRILFVGSDEWVTATHLEFSKGVLKFITPGEAIVLVRADQVAAFRYETGSGYSGL